MNFSEKRLIFVVSILYLVRMLGLFMVFPVLGAYAAEIEGSSPILIGLALGGYGVTQAILQVPMGWLSDIFGRKSIIIVGLVIFFLGSIVAGLASDIYAMIIGRLLQGGGAIAGSVMALIIDNTRESQRAKSMAIVGASIGVSFSLAMVLGPVVAAFLGISGVFYLTASLSIMGIVLVSYGIPSQSTITTHHDMSAMWNLKTVFRACKDSNLQSLYFGIFCLHFILTTSFSFVPYSLQVLFNIPRDAHWYIYLPIVLGSLLGVLFILNIFEKNSRSRRSFIFFIVILGLSVLGLLFVKNFFIYACFLLIFFVTFNYFEATLPGLVGSQVLQRNRGLALGLFSTSQFLGAAFGGLFGGWLFQFDSVVWILCLIPVIFWFFLELHLSFVGRD